MKNIMFLFAFVMILFIQPPPLNAVPANDTEISIRSIEQWPVIVLPSVYDVGNVMQICPLTTQSYLFPGNNTSTSLYTGYSVQALPVSYSLGYMFPYRCSPERSVYNINLALPATSNAYVAPVLYPQLE